jgi:sirohydrochlorin ferrochelatase
MNSGPKTGAVALVLVDHGSRSDAANRSLEDVAREVERLAAGRYVAVLPAHMDIASPTIADAFDAAVAAGARTVIVVLYFLAPGRHSESDVPRLAAEAAARHPGIEYTVSASLGPHAALASLVLDRAADALAGAEKV